MSHFKKEPDALLECGPLHVVELWPLNTYIRERRLQTRKILLCFVKQTTKSKFELNDKHI